MAKALLRLTSELYNTPQLITAGAADEIISYLAIRNSENYVVQAKVNKNFLDNGRTRDENTLKRISENGIALLDVDGPLSYTVSELDALCGAVSYEQLEYEFNQAVASPDIHTIVLYVDSPGGEAYGCFELANYMRKKAKENGKRLVTYVDGAMYSAALALGVASDEIIANPYADQGSIGVLIRLQNVHKFRKKMGLEETFIYAGEEKIPYDKDGDYKEEFINDLQEKVDALYSKFVTHVAECTGMTEKAVIGTKAKTFSSDEALKLGLIDKVMEREQFFNYLADQRSNTGTTAATMETEVVTPVAEGATENSSTGVIEKSDEDNSGMKPEDIQALQEQLVAAQKEIERLNADAKDRAKAELKAKLSGFGIKEESLAGLTEVVSKLQDADKEILFGVFEKNKTDMATLNTKVTELEKRLNGDMFKTLSAQGEGAPTEDDQNLRTAVGKKIAAQVNKGENK